ncbi:MAG TPA: sigma-70 family RNA polymerase sigma factor [Candidatus Bathyarchaeia archaeon]|nr:sigma-70 family RNA polymerase sigma factor [Candidatus Bathyarchaeia archaeon]
MDSAAHYPVGGERPEWRLPEACAALTRRLFAESPASRWQLSFQSFQSALTRSAAKRFSESSPSLEKIQEYFASLHMKDLVLACACADGSENAWNEFVAEYRSYLRAAAATILRRPIADPAALDLADSLFADLYGVSGGKTGGRSLFRYFHGRSSLKTWLRAVLAQRHIDAVRAEKKFDPLDDGAEDGERRRVPELSVSEPPSDPHRDVYLERFREALTVALASLDVRDCERMRLYYAQDLTLAEIGRELGEHESSVSRNLERVRRELRGTVEGLLRAGKAAANGGPVAQGGAGSAGMSDAQIALCIQYAAEDSAMDLDKLFESRGTKKRSGPDRILEP